MKKFVLLCAILAALCCLAYAETLTDDAAYSAAKDRYYQLIDKVANGTATYAESVEFGDLCQVYSLEFPAKAEEERDRGSLDDGGGDCDNPTEIPECPWADTGFFDGDNDCSVPAVAPSNEVFYHFVPPFTGGYQMRVRNYGTVVPGVRVVTTACCTGATNPPNWYYSASSVAGAECGEPTTVVTYLYVYLTEGQDYWIHVGTSTTTVYTTAYDFNLWCVPCPPMEPEAVHNTCQTAFEITCGDSITGDSATSTAATFDWYKVVVPDYSPMLCSLRVFVGGRELGHCISGKYPAYTTAPLGAPDGRASIFREQVGNPCVLDSIRKIDDEGCSYDAKGAVLGTPGTYYIKVWNINVNQYVLTTECFVFDPIAACCFIDGSCQDLVAAECALAGGWSKPIGVLCGTYPCPPTTCPGDVLDNEGVNNVCGPDVPEVVCDGWYCGVIPMASDTDWYKLVVPEGVCETLWVDIYGNDTPSKWPFNQGLDPYVRLIKEDCITQLAYNSDNYGVDPLPVTDDSRLKYTINRPGTYYIKLHSEYGLVGPYLMHITCTTFECPDLTGDICTDPRVIGALPYTDAGKTTCGFTDDYRPTCLGSYGNGPDIIYTIYLDGVTCIGCSLFTNATSYGSVSLYANCPTLATEPCIAKSVGQSSGPYGFSCQGVDGALPAGTYYIMVDNYAPGPDCIVSYTLNVFSCTCPSPCPYPNRDTEVSDLCGPAQPPIACGELLCGMISAVADTDWYQFELTECDSVTIDVYANDTPGQWPFGLGLDPYAYLYKSDCITQISSNDDIGGSPYNDDSQVKSGCVLQPGTYYIAVKSAASTFGPYVLRLTCYPASCPDLTGDVCETPRVIPSLPYTDVATTCCYFNNDYLSTTCLGSAYYDGPDVIYKLTLDGNTCFACTVTAVANTGSIYHYGAVALWNACPTVDGACIVKTTASSGPMVLNCQGPLGPLPAGDYYIQIDNNPTPICINYTLKVALCDCPPPCETYTLCGSPGEVEPDNNTCPVATQPEITCNTTVYGLHCLYTDVDFWKVTIAPMSIMTIKVYTGAACDVNPAVGVLFRYYNDLCASPTTGVATSVVISNMTTDPLVKYLEVYDTGQKQTLYKVVATCCQITNYCVNPIFTGPGTLIGGFYTFEANVNTCCATNVVDTVGSTGCATGSRFASGPDVVFMFMLATTNIVSISVNSVGTGDGQFSLFTDCANPKTSCIISQDDEVGTTPEVANNLVLPGGTYYVSVSDFGTTTCGEMHILIVSDCPLPVNLLGDVVATPGNEKIKLSWTTASETNNARFEIVRDGRVIGRVEGSGTSTTQKSYEWSEEGLNNNRTYSYTLRSVDMNENPRELATVEATPSFAAGEVTEYALHQNYPNPFNPVTSIAFDLLASGHVTLKIYNLMGQEVRTVVNGVMPKGRQIVSFDAGSLSSGIYLYRVEVNGFAAEKKMLLMK